MPLLPAKCPICGAILNIESEKEAAICPNCNNAFVVEKAINNYRTYNTINADTVVVQNESEKEQLNKNGETYIKLGYFEKAKEYYEQLVEKFPDDYRGWWGLIRCKFLKNDLNKIQEQSKNPYVCKICGYSITEWREKCPSCDNRNTLTKDIGVFQRQQMSEIKKIMGFLEILAPSEVYIEYKGIVDHFLHVQAQRNAIEAATQRKNDAFSAMTELEKQVASARANIEKLKEAVNTEHLRIEELKQNYEHKIDLINQRKEVKGNYGYDYDNPIRVYNSHLGNIDNVKDAYEEANKKMIPFRIFLGVGVAFAVLGIFAAESLIIAVFFLLPYWWLGDFRRSKYKEAKKRLTEVNAILSGLADKAKDNLRAEYEYYGARIRKSTEESREDIEQEERKIALQEEEIQKCKKLLDFEDAEIQKFYLTVWHQWFELESVSYDERLNEWLLSER